MKGLHTILFLTIGIIPALSLNGRDNPTPAAWKLQEPLTPTQQAAVTKMGIVGASFSTQFATNTYLSCKYGSGITFMEYLQSLHGASSADTMRTGEGPTKRPLIGPAGPVIIGGLPQYRSRPEFVRSDKMYTGLSYASVVPCVVSNMRSSTYFASAYELRNDPTKWRYQMGMGIGLAINGALLATGGATQLPVTIKYPLYGISTTATMGEAKNQFQAGYALWYKDRKEACLNFGMAGIFTAAAILPFALDYSKNKLI